MEKCERELLLECSRVCCALLTSEYKEEMRKAGEHLSETKNAKVFREQLESMQRLEQEVEALNGK